MATILDSHEINFKGYEIAYRLWMTAFSLKEYTSILALT